MNLCVQQELLSRAHDVIVRLRKAGTSVVTAESCTAGLIAAVLSYGEKASECFHGGFVVYTKQQKSTSLGVDPGLLKERGSVNEIVAAQMAEGALHRSAAKIALSVTGVLGPQPDEDNNPPGLVYLALARSGRPTVVAQHAFKSADPDGVRKSVVLEALELIAFGAE